VDYYCVPSRMTHRRNCVSFTSLIVVQRQFNVEQRVRIKLCILQFTHQLNES
jgi:hypothetical protein